MNPLVSICCTTYNHELYINDAIEGFLMQKTNFPIEIIIHDDASTDKTALIIKEYADKHPGLIIPILQKENQWSQGIRPSLKFVWPRTQGKYIALCEGDDYWTDPNKLQKQVDLLEKNQEFSICFHEVKILKEGILCDDFITNRRIDRSKHIYDTYDLSFGNFFHTPSVLFKNIPSIYENELIFKSPVGDYILWLLLSTFGPIIRIDDIMAVYRINDGGIWSSIESLKKDKMIIEYLSILSDKFIHPSVINIRKRLYYLIIKRFRLNAANLKILKMLKDVLLLLKLKYKIING